MLKYIIDLSPFPTYDIDMWIEVQKEAGGVGSSGKISKATLVTALQAAMFPIAHSTLTTLTNDDHPQYFNTARGDARYALQGAVGIPEAPVNGVTYARRDAAWVATGGAGTGDVVGPISAINNNVALFNGITGKLLKDGGALGSAAFVASASFDVAGAATTAQAAAIAAAAIDATTKANAAQAFAIQRANHTDTQSLDTTTDSATRLALLPAERTKLAGIATGATANSTDAFLLARANHTGTQAAATVTGLAAVATSGLKADVGLGNVDNTSDVNKPISTATSTALAAKADLVSGKVPSSQLPAISLGSTTSVASQAAMLALTAEIGDVAIRTDLANRKFLLLGTSTTLADWVAMDASGLPVDSVNGYEGAVVLVKADVGLGNVDNTSDVNKPVSTAQATAIGLKADKAITISTTAPLTGGGDLSASRTFAISAASGAAAGSMSAADFTKLSGIATAATANSTDAFLLSRANHTGTQLAATISDFSTAVAATASVTANTAKVTNATHTGEVTGATALTITPAAVTLAKMADVATGTVFYRKTAGTGVPEVQTLATLKTDLGLTGTNTGDQTITLTGNVTGSGTGSFATTIANNAVSLGMMAQVVTATFLGRTTAATGNVEALTVAQAKTLLNLTGTNTGDQTTITGNAGTATALQTPRAINGVNFDGTAAITINAVDATARVPTTRLISTTAPITGGGDLSADLTLAMAAAASGVSGYLSAADWAIFNAKEPAIAAGTTAQFRRGDTTWSNALLGPLGIGTAPTVGYNFEMNLNVTGAVSARYMRLSSAIQSDVTTEARVFESVPSTAAAAFTLPNLYNFFVNQGTFGAGSTVTNQFGYYVSSTMIGATNNYGFYSNLAAATGRYNIYMPGTADNYLGGRLGIGSASTIAQSFRMGLNLTGAVSSYGAVQAGIVQSDVTTAGISYYSLLGTQAATFATGALRDFSVYQGAYGVGSTVTNHQGLYVDASCVGATNNHAVSLNIPAIPAGSGTTARTITTIDVTTNVVTVTTSAAHGFITGQRVTVAATTNTGINGSGQVIASTPTTTTFTYARTMANITSVADTGTVTPAANWNIYAVGTAPNYLAGPLLIGSTTDDTVNKLQVTGNIATQAIGNGFRIKEGTNAKMGVATLVAGTVTVSNTSVTANSRIFIDSNTGGGTPGWLRISARTAGTSFTILSSSATDTSVVAWVIFEPT